MNAREAPTRPRQAIVFKNKRKAGRLLELVGEPYYTRDALGGTVEEALLGPAFD